MSVCRGFEKQATFLYTYKCKLCKLASLMQTGPRTDISQCIRCPVCHVACEMDGYRSRVTVLATSYIHGPARGDRSANLLRPTLADGDRSTVIYVTDTIRSHTRLFTATSQKCSLYSVGIVRLRRKMVNHSNKLIQENKRKSVINYILRICLAVSIEYRRVTNGQTDRQADILRRIVC